jgi:uncharacterized protein
MQSGGIHDQLGGGFHRYSTDERWLVPHFEKMLYDNALLLRLYGNGVRVFGEQSYADTARGIVEWLSREMTRDDGVFFSAQDADSEGEEGKFFVWTAEEIARLLPSDARLVCDAFGVTEEGNFAEPGHEPDGASVLFRSQPVAHENLEAFARCKAAMMAAREKRPKPFRDDKVMVSLNALMIGALADAGLALDEPSWIERARIAFERLWSLTTTNDASVRLARYVKDEHVVGSGFLDDYAYLASAALDLYEATGLATFVVRARALAQSIDAHFRDRKGGGFFMSATDGETLIVRSKDVFDHAVPSGAAVAVTTFLRLGSLVDESWLNIAEEELSQWVTMADEPFGHAALVLALDLLARGSTEVVVANDMEGMLARAVGRQSMVHRLLARVDLSDPSSREACHRLLDGKESNRDAVAWICQAKACSRPLTNALDVTTHLQELRKSLK